MAKITVRVDESGALVEVEIEGHLEFPELIPTRRAEPLPPFKDEEFRAARDRVSG